LVVRATNYEPPTEPTTNDQPNHQPTMMSMDIAALGAAPTPPDAGCASTETSEGASGFAELLDEAAGTDGESLEPSSVANNGDIDEDDTFDELAALVITSLLSINATSATPVEAVDGQSGTATGEIGNSVAIDQVMSPDALIDVNAQGEGDQIPANNEADANEAAALPASVRTAASPDPASADAAPVDAATAADMTSVTAAVDKPAIRGETPNANTTRGDAETSPRVEPTAAQATRARGSKAPRTEHDRAPQAPGSHAKVAQAIAAAAGGQSTADAAHVSGRGHTTDAPAPASTAARFARALERAAALTGNESTSSTPSAVGTDPGSGQSSSFNNGSADRHSESFVAPRHANGPLSFTVAAPTAFDVRTLTRAVDAAGHSMDTGAATIPERDVVAQLVQSLRVQFRDGIGEAVVRLKPEHLGSVQVSLKIENGAIRATVHADVAAVRQWLESQQDTLRTGLAEHGLRLERFVVEPDGERRSARDDAQPREERRRQQQRRMSGTDHPVFEVTV
jgi:flagellar hook-length control protein FliK